MVRFPNWGEEVLTNESPSMIVCNRCAMILAECPSLSGFKVKRLLGRTALMIYAFGAQNDAA